MNGYIYLLDAAKLWKRDDVWKNKISKSNFGKIRTKEQSLNIKLGVTKVQGKPVLQYDLNGNFIAEYVSIAEAARQTNSNGSKITMVCQNRRIKHNKFKWKYKINLFFNFLIS